MAREIKFLIEDYIDTKLKNDPLAKLAIKTKDPRALFVQAMYACVGIREKTGHNDGPLVESIQSTIGGHSREAWCMALVQTCLAYVEKKLGAKSPVYTSEHCMTTWAKTPTEFRVKGTPLAGAIVIWQHGKGPAGHTGIVTSCGDKTMETIEGNTTAGVSASGKVVREGGGVYRNKRNRKANGNMKVQGFLIPFPVK